MNAMRTYRILILEDDLETLSVIMDRLSVLERELERAGRVCDFAVTVFSEEAEARRCLARTAGGDFDLALLDRDSGEGGSFHAVFDIESFGPDRVISISSVPAFNDQAMARGVKIAVHKNYSRLKEFGDELYGYLARHFFISRKI
jgi:CheY-like chemotaxis protein